MENMTGLMLFITILAPITTAVTEVIKRTLPKLPARYYTALAVIAGVGLASVAWTFTDLNASYRLWGGLFAGLSSAKLFDISKDLAGAIKK